MEIWYVTVSIQVVMTYYTYEYQEFFNSKEAMEKFIKKFEATNLRQIVGKGKAQFNDLGILIPELKAKRCKKK